MRTPDQDDVIELLACDIAARPAGAPTPDELAPHVRSRARTDGALSIEFSSAAADSVAAFAAAESLCCASIGWSVEREPAVRLIISAAPEQLDAIEQLFASA